MATYAPKPGSIIHVELSSDDPDGTEAFYADAFGWAFEAVGGMDYTMWRSADPPFGGLVAAEAVPDVPPVLCYLQTDDLADTVEALEGAGGEVVSEDEVAGMGVFAVFREPGGVVEAVWQATGEPDGSDGDGPRFTDEPSPGSVVHVELYTDDVDATMAFHEAVFDWEFEVLEGAYTLARPPTPPLGGVMPASAEMPVGTLVYVLVDDAAASCETMAAAGGEVLREPFEVEGWGTMAVVAAPGGIVQAVWERATVEAETAESMAAE